MSSILIKDTTREQRERIIAESLGNIDVSCDGCPVGIVEMYQDYIDGKLELYQVNQRFQARYVSGSQGPERPGCPGGF